MERLSHGRNGEFYTPEDVCSMIARMSIQGSCYCKRIADPACGSGRTLMAAAAVAGKLNYFYGYDISGTAVKMCALNMWMNGLQGYAVHGDRAPACSS